MVGFQIWSLLKTYIFCRKSKSNSKRLRRVDLAKMPGFYYWNVFSLKTIKVFTPPLFLRKLKSKFSSLCKSYLVFLGRHAELWRPTKKIGSDKVGHVSLIFCIKPPDAYRGTTSFRKIAPQHTKKLECGAIRTIYPLS